MGKGEGYERKAKSRHDAKAADIIGRRSAEDRGCTTRSLGESQSEKKDSQSLVRFPSKLTALLKQKSCTHWTETRTELLGRIRQLPVSKDTSSTEPIKAKWHFGRAPRPQRPLSTCMNSMSKC